MKTTGCEIPLYAVLYLAWSWYISPRKHRLVMNWYSFFDHLIALKTLKSLTFFGLTPWKPTRAMTKTPSYNYDQFTIAFPLIKLNLLPQNRHYLKCLDKSLTFVFYFLHIIFILCYWFDQKAGNTFTSYFYF